MRRAIVTGTCHPATTLEQVVRAYLPGNYEVVAAVEDRVLIEGVDIAGWTLEDYVIPRLASGLHACKEVQRLCEFGCMREATHYGGYAGANEWAGYVCETHADQLAWVEEVMRV
jgi:hypothetical protein